MKLVTYRPGRNMMTRTIAAAIAAATVNCGSSYERNITCVSPTTLGVGAEGTREIESRGIKFKFTPKKRNDGETDLRIEISHERQKYSLEIKEYEETNIVLSDGSSDPIAILVYFDVERNGGVVVTKKDCAVDRDNYQVPVGLSYMVMERTH